MTPPSLRLPAPRLITSSARGVPAGGAASAAAASDPPRLGLFGFLGCTSPPHFFGLVAYRVYGGMHGMFKVTHYNVFGARWRRASFILNGG